LSEGIASTSLGYKVKALGIGSTAIGRETEAIGDYSFATGYLSNASGSASFTSGYLNKANGIYSTAIGRENIVNGRFGTGIGYNNLINGNYSTAIGKDLICNDDNTICLSPTNIFGNLNVTGDLFVEDDIIISDDIFLDGVLRLNGIIGITQPLDVFLATGYLDTVLITDVGGALGYNVSTRYDGASNSFGVNINGTMVNGFVSDGSIYSRKGYFILGTNDNNENYSTILALTEANDSSIQFKGLENKWTINDDTEISGDLTSTGRLSSTFGSIIGTGTEYFSFESKTLAPYGTYPILRGISAGGFNNVTIIPESLIILDEDNDESTSINFVADDVSDVAQIKYREEINSFELRDGLGSAKKNLIVTGNVTINGNLMVDGCITYNNTGTPVTLGDCI